MPASRPQYYKNTLQPIEINKANLKQALKELQLAVKQGTEVVRAGCPSPVDPSNYGSIYSGTPGIALSFLRLERQKASLADEHPLPDFAGLARERIISTPADLRLPPGRMSPIGSPLGPVVLRILVACEGHGKAADDAAGGSRSISPDDIRALHDAVQRSLQHGHVIHYRDRDMGGDEVLYGRAGLLWAILNIRNHVFDADTRAALRPIFEAVPKLVDAIVEAGKKGAQDFVKQYGAKDAFPLMWLWMEDYYGLGAVHGIAGILTVLLACELEELEDGGSRNYLPLIAGTITSLCRICIANDGHMPTSIPQRPSSRSSPLVQICHGSPGLLVLLATARRDARLTSAYWQPEWDEAIRLGTEKVWQEGLLAKGGSLCHGLTGNAWPLLMLHDCFEYDVEDMKKAKQAYLDRVSERDESTPTEQEDLLSSDYFLSRALAFMLLARESPPYSTALNFKTSSYDFRMPDRPYSLYEGLAGELCAWAETCVVIQARLRKMELEEEKGSSAKPTHEDEIFEEYMMRQLGFPGLGGNGPSGLL
ncbi:hypothetical protein VTN77DRAFT_1271 [Rasamsonia byssochlamydoides]|uniref:uncharacterized protein n=1 Tax=Rasamsonia byssochlamydoides TaxID=89139 RepID=UPI0037431872